MALDTSVIVAAMLSVHEHHAAALPFVADLRASGAPVSLDGPASWALLGEAAAAEVIGGAVYDFHIATCARLANANELATFNRRHFERFGLPGLRIVVPGAEAG